MKLLGIDYGKTRLGLAISDDIGMLAHEYNVVKNWTNEDLLHYLTQVIALEAVDKIVIGMPRHMSGEDSEKTQEVREFAAMLENVLDREVAFEDERWTTKMADQTLREMKISQKEARDRKDMIAAKYILQSYMDGIKDDLD
jgi:putative Holliday junction resolvase